MATAAPSIWPTLAAEVTDLEALLAAMPGENPAGENLQYSGLFDEIREARRADENLDQGAWKFELKVANWDKVITLASEALKSKSKDLQLCAWLSEAFAKLHGFAGLRDGLRLVRGLHERFWEKFYPEIDEGDLEARSNALYFMDRQLAMAIKDAPLTQSFSGTDYGYFRWEEAKQFDVPENLDQLSSSEAQQVTQLKARAAEEGKITSEDWRKAKNATRRPFYEALFSQLAECWAEFLALERIVDEKYARQAPSLSELKKTIDDIRAIVDKLVKEKRLLEPDPIIAPEAVAEGEAQTVGAAGAVGYAAASGPIKSRQEALKQLAVIAEYFHQTEPHSPVAYLVQRAAKWGEMGLDGWLEEVVKDTSVLANLREVLGIRPGTGGGS